MRLLQALMSGDGPRIDASPGQGRQMPGAGLPGPFGGVRGGYGGPMMGGGLMGGMGGQVQPPDAPPPVGMGGPTYDKPNAGTDNLGQSPYGDFNRRMPRRNY